MKSIRLFVGFALISLAVASLWGSTPNSLSLEDLQGHPERWPRSLALPKDTKWQKGIVIKKGAPMTFVELRGEEMVLESGTEVRLVVPVAGSELVADVNRWWKTLTPAQRALDAEALMADASLWPEKVAIMEKLNVSNEWPQIDPGQEFYLLGFDADGVLMGAESRARRPIYVDARQTDLFERARARVALAESLRPSRVAAALRGRLVDLHGAPVAAANLEETRLFALYFGAGWCAPCRAFSPQLVQTIGAAASKNPGLTVVFLSNDKSSSAMMDYMAKVKMPWPAVSVDRWSTVPLLMGYARGMVPQLVVVDRHGRILADSFEGDRYVGPQGAFRELQRLLDTGMAR